MAGAMSSNIVFWESIELDTHWSETPCPWMRWRISTHFVICTNGQQNELSSDNYTFKQHTGSTKKCYFIISTLDEPDVVTCDEKIYVPKHEIVEIPSFIIECMQNKNFGESSIDKLPLD